MARSIDTFTCRRSAIGNPFRPKRAENAWESQGFRKYPASSESAIVSRSRASPKSHCAGVRDRRALDEIQKRGLVGKLLDQLGRGRDGREALLELRGEAGDRARPGVAAGKEHSALELERAEGRLDAVLVLSSHTGRERAKVPGRRDQVVAVSRCQNGDARPAELTQDRETSQPSAQDDRFTARASSVTCRSLLVEGEDELCPAPPAPTLMVIAPPPDVQMRTDSRLAICRLAPSSRPLRQAGSP